jgi:hypothetical protein
VRQNRQLVGFLWLLPKWRSLIRNFVKGLNLTNPAGSRFYASAVPVALLRSKKTARGIAIPTINPLIDKNRRAAGGKLKRL